MTRPLAIATFSVVGVLAILLAGWAPSAPAQSGAEPDARPDTADERGIDGREGDGRGRVLQPERAFGRMLGDVLVQRVRLADGETIDAAALPPEGRVDAWFARLPSRVTEDGRGRRHVELRYQLVNSPLAATVASMPATELAIVGGDAVSIASWPVAIVPLLPDASGAGGAGAAAPVVDASTSRPSNAGGNALADALPAMRPDRRSAPLDTARLRVRARSTGLLLGAILIVWASWWGWRRRRDAVRLPFSRAASALRRLDAGQREESATAWRAAHAALNATAGQVSGPVAIDALLARAPWLQPYRERLLAFHDASAGRFFEQPPRVEPFALQAFVHDLGRAERRQAR